MEGGGFRCKLVEGGGFRYKLLVGGLGFRRKLVLIGFQQMGLS